MEHTKFLSLHKKTARVIIGGLGYDHHGQYRGTGWQKQNGFGSDRPIQKAWILNSYGGTQPALWCIPNYTLLNPST